MTERPERLALYRIKNPAAKGYDIYAAAIVAAPNEHIARLTHPAEERGPHVADEAWDYDVWCHPDDVVVEVIGMALPGTVRGVVLTDFNNG